MRNPLPRRYARYYLENAPSLVWLLVVTVSFTVLGLRYYVDRELAEVSTFLWPLFADSPTATLLAAFSFVTLWPGLGRPLEAQPTNRPLAYLHTFAFVWLVKFGLWTFVALNVGFDAYFPDPFAYFGVVLSHLGFVAIALLIPHYGRTTRGALAAALVVSLLNDALDYGFGLHPPLLYEPGLFLPIATVLLTIGSVWLAAALFEPIRAEEFD